MASGRITEAQARRFKELAWPMLPVVLRTAQCLTRRDDVAEDLAQETMVKAMRAIDTYEDGTNIKAWLLTILRRTHIDRLRRDRDRPLHLSIDAVDGDWPDTEHTEGGQYDEQWREPEELMNRLDDEQIVKAMEALPDEIRWTLLLVDVEQLPLADVADVLEIPVGTVKSRVHRGRGMLRDCLYETAVKRGWLPEARRLSS